jgi:hypothetical protein
MKTLAFLFTAATALTLTACGGANDSAADDTADATMREEAPVPTVTETAIVQDADGVDSSAPDSVSISPDGVKVDVDSNGTRVQADSDSGSVTVSE